MHNPYTDPKHRSLNPTRMVSIFQSFSILILGFWIIDKNVRHAQHMPILHISELLQQIVELVRNQIR